MSTIIDTNDLMKYNSLNYEKLKGNKKVYHRLESTINIGLNLRKNVQKVNRK